MTAEQVVLVGASPNTPTIPVMWERVQQIRKVVPLDGSATDGDAIRSHELIEAACAEWGEPTSQIDRYGVAHGPHAWYTFVLDDGNPRQLICGVHAGSMSEAALDVMFWWGFPVDVGWVDPDYQIHAGLKANQKSFDKEIAASEKRHREWRAKYHPEDVTVTGGLLDLLGDAS